jgi:hypothetical protein
VTRRRSGRGLLLRRDREVSLDLYRRAIDNARARLRARNKRGGDRLQELFSLSPGDPAARAGSERRFPHRIARAASTSGRGSSWARPNVTMELQGRRLQEATSHSSGARSSRRRRSRSSSSRSRTVASSWGKRGQAIAARRASRLGRDKFPVAAGASAPRTNPRPSNTALET